VTDYDNPEVDARWCLERRGEIAAYLQREGLTHGEIGDAPAWHVAPYVSVWAIESVAAPGHVGWWAISGDLPNDYVSADRVRTPREAVRAIASRWQEVVAFMSRGEEHPAFRIGAGQPDQGLAPLLASRARLLLDWVDDAELWEEG
jgi:hypothetical protein